MDKEKEIDYEYLIHSHSCVGKEKECEMNLPCNECIKKDFEAVGLGNVKQAVKEFAERLKGSFYNMDYSAIAIDNKIDSLVTELYGTDEKEKI